MTASYVVDAQNWNTIFKLGKLMAVVVIGYVLLSSFSTGTKIPICLYI